MSQPTNPVVQPYLFFPGTCEEAIEFYKTALGARVDFLMRFSESPEPPPPDMLAPGSENKVMHTSFHIGESMIMASDSCGDGEAISGFSLSLAVNTEAEADRYFHALADGGAITMPLDKTFWSPRFGMVTDKFGVSWMINTVAEASCA